MRNAFFDYIRRQNKPLSAMITTKAIQAFQQIETPFYYYDMALLRRPLEECSKQAGLYGYKVHYAVKANDDPRILALVRDYGFGVDCVSGGEVKLALDAGFAPEKIVFAGVGKTDREINLALDAGISCFNVESIPELEVIDSLARAKGVQAPVCIRVNPDIDAHTHRYITTGLEENKFGISAWAFDELVEALRAAKNIAFKGLHLHIGSQITIMEPFKLECKRALQIVARFREAGFEVTDLNLGGGLGVDYGAPALNPVPPFEAWFGTVAENLPVGPGQTVHFEPGRALVAQCGYLISRAVFVKKGKDRKFVILDAGMNDLIRPALYGARHNVENLTSRGGMLRYDVVGPVCESSDIWGEGLLLPAASRGDLFAISTAGAYGQVMSMRYNQRPFAKAYYSDEVLK